MERGPDALGYSIMAGDMKGLIGHMERLGVATAAETNTVLSSPPLAGVRARTP
jgi:hypothetical protein